MIEIDQVLRKYLNSDKDIAGAIKGAAFIVRNKDGVSTGPMLCPGSYQS